MKPGHRIIFNTLATYGHSVFGLVLSLFSARWILQALGEVDFGLFGVVGSIIILMTFLNGGLAVGVSRFYAYSIGRGHHLPEEAAVDDLMRWFNTAFSIHLVLPVFLILLGWPVGEYAIQHWLTIPPDRVEACLWVFRISLISAFMSVFSVPFVSMYVANQLISELAIFGILSSLGNFVVAWILLNVQGDRLIFYASCTMAIAIAISLLQILRAMIRFKACRIRFSYLYQKESLRHLFGFVGWKMFGMTCVVLRGQGAPVLANLYFGPLINAAYSVAYRVSMHANTLSEAMTGAFQPALISAEGKGERDKMMAMAMQVCKFGSLLILLFVVPLLLEMPTLLRLWLKAPPVFADQLCRWMLAMLVVDRMTAGPMLAVNAFGKIAVYEMVQGILLFLALPLMWLMFGIGMNPSAMGGALFISMTFYCVGRLVFSRYLVQFPVGKWLLQVAYPVLVLLVSSSIVGWAVMSALDEGFFRLCLTSAATAAVTVSVGWLLLLDPLERNHASSLFKSILNRIMSTIIRA